MTATRDNEATRSETLADLADGQAARVESLAVDGGERRRLLDLGLVPGTPIEAVLRSAAGDPVAYRFRGVTMALRRSDAAQVRVAPVASAGDGEEGR